MLLLHIQGYVMPTCEFYTTVKKQLLLYEKDI